jgi:hypothetical protein
MAPLKHEAATDPGQGQEKPNKRPIMPHRARSPRLPRTDTRPRTQAESAILCEIYDRGYSETGPNARRLRQVLDLGGVPLLRRLLDMAMAPRVCNVGGYLQWLVMRQLRA